MLKLIQLYYLTLSRAVSETSPTFSFLRTKVNTGCPDCSRRSDACCQPSLRWTKTNLYLYTPRGTSWKEGFRAHKMQLLSLQRKPSRRSQTRSDDKLRTRDLGSTSAPGWRMHRFRNLPTEERGKTEFNLLCIIAIVAKSRVFYVPVILVLVSVLVPCTLSVSLQGPPSSCSSTL